MCNDYPRCPDAARAGDAGPADAGRATRAGVRDFRPITTRREFLVATGAAAMAYVAGGCGGGGGGGGGGGISPSPTFGRGSVSGFVFTSASGPPVLGYTSTAPSGYVVASGVEVSVEAAGAAQTAADGSFTLKNVPTGLRTLTVTVGGKKTQYPLTVVDGATVRVGAPPVKRADAVSAARAELANLEIDTASAAILATQQPLPSGVLVAPVFTMADASSADRTVTSSPQWLVYLDLNPCARFGHRVLYAFVDAANGRVRVVDTDSWPTINGFNYYAEHSENIGSADLVSAPDASRAARPSPTQFIMRYLPSNMGDGRNAGSGCSGGQVHALIVQGDDRSDFAADPAHVQGLFGRGPFPSAAHVVTIKTSQTQNAMQAIQDQFAAMCGEMSSCDTFVFYASSHGGKATNMVYAIQLELPGGGPGNGVQARYAYLSPTALDFSLCKACNIVVMVDTCHAGLFIDRTTTQLAGFPGKEVVVMAACTTNQLATGVTTGAPKAFTLNGKAMNAPVGGLFTSGMVYAFDQGGLPADLYTGLAAAFGTALQYVTAYVQSNATVYGIVPGNPPNQPQTPEIWQRTLVDGEVCGGGSVTSTIK